jgi:symplekin
MLGVLIRTRPGTSSRILNAVLAFNPLRLASSQMTPKTRVMVKSMEKTTRMLLIHLMKRYVIFPKLPLPCAKSVRSDPHGPMTPRIQQHVERLVRSRAEIFDDAGRKRTLAEPSPAYNDAKRQRLGGVVTITQPRPPTLLPAQNSLASMFTLASNPGLRGFSVAQLTPGLAAKLCVSALARTDGQHLTRAITVRASPSRQASCHTDSYQLVRDRLAALDAADSQTAALNPDTVPLGVEEDEDDDYEPDFYAAEDTEQILNKLESAPPEQLPSLAHDTSVALTAFRLPPPPPVDGVLAARVGQGAVGRVFGVLQTLEDTSATRKYRTGLNRLAASSYDRDAWVTVIARLAARSIAQQSSETTAKSEDEPDKAMKEQSPLNDVIREALFVYVLEDFRKRIDVAVSWLCEEWYADRIRGLYGDSGNRQYDKWAMRLVDGFLPYLHPQDKVLTRFLGEVPELSAMILDRVKSLCRDPSLVPLALTSLLYLVMMRPPVRGLALDAVQDIWTDCEPPFPVSLF